MSDSKSSPAQMNSSTSDRSDGTFEDGIARARGLVESDPAAALSQAEDLLQMRQDPRLYRLAAKALRGLGRNDHAVATELAGIKAGLSDPELDRAAVARDEGRSLDSLTIAEGYLRREPDDLLALTVAAEAAIDLWQLERAEEMLRAVLLRAPTFLRASILLSTCLARQVRPREAAALLDDVVTRKPDNRTALTYLAQLRSEVRDVEEAVLVHEKLTSLEPGRPERWINLAQYYRIVGRREDSVKAFRKALDIDPGNGSAWWSLANYFPATLDQKDQQAIMDALGDRAGKPDEPALYLALGLVADRKGERAEAFEHFATGKRIRAANQSYDPERISAAVDGVIGTLTPDFYASRRTAGWSDDSPIFILGMPRSGTTLVERILGRHTAIEGAGELPIVQRLAEGARRLTDDQDAYAALLEALPDSDLERVGRDYVRASSDYRLTDKPRFIDKNNLNWMHIGLILLALPDAPILDVRRDALDCCWANFKMLFAEGFPATNDLRHVGRFYADYVRLLDAMKVAAPGRILSVSYEDVVDDLEGSTRRILDFLGLPFEPSCLDFHLSTDAVATASSEQVRSPINRKGIGSAQPYRQWLGPMIEELGLQAGR